MSTIDDETRFEERIRDGLASRDPGPAPARLRHRVDAVTTDTSTRGARIDRLVGVLRPAVAATLTLAAILLGVLIVAVVRPSPTSQPGPAPTPEIGGPSPGVDLATVGDPIALPLGWVVFIVLAALLVAWAAVEVYLRTPSGTRVELRRLRRKRARGLIVLVLATPILILSEVVRNDTSLGQGGFFEASLVHLEGMGPTSHPTTNREVPAAYFRFVTGGTVTFVQAVRNAGGSPITVMGPTGADVGLELRLFAVHDPSGPIDVDTMPTYPFAPFRLAPGEEQEIVVVIHLGWCPGSPAPTSEPSPDLSGDYVPPEEPSSMLTFETLGLTYSVLGFAREVDVPIFVAVVVRSPAGSGCDVDPTWTRLSASPAAP